MPAEDGRQRDEDDGGVDRRHQHAERRDEQRDPLVSLVGVGVAPGGCRRHAGSTPAADTSLSPGRMLPPADVRGVRRGDQESGRSAFASLTGTRGSGSGGRTTWRARDTNSGVTFVVLATATLAFSLLQSLIIPAIPQLEHTLHTSESGASWLLTAYLLSAAIATPILGRLGDTIGKEKMMVIVLIALSVGTLRQRAGDHPPGHDRGSRHPGHGRRRLPSRLRHHPRRVPRRAGGRSHRGVVGHSWGWASGRGILLAGPILEHLSYHWLFWFPLVMALGATVATFVFVPESPVRAPGASTGSVRC